MKWIHNGSLPERWSHKKDVPPHLRHNAKRVEFRFELAWIVRDENGKVLFPNGMMAECLDFYLLTPGHVIGLRDLETAQNQEWADEWRQAMHARIKERLQLQTQI